MHDKNTIRFTSDFTMKLSLNKDVHCLIPITVRLFHFVHVNSYFLLPHLANFQCWQRSLHFSQFIITVLILRTLGGFHINRLLSLKLVEKDYLTDKSVGRLYSYLFKHDVLLPTLDTVSYAIKLI